MDFIKKLTSTKYGDYKGYVSIDTHSGTDLFNLCKDNGIDTKKYFPIGFTIGESTIDGIGRRNEICISMYLVLTEIAGMTYDDIEKFIKDNNGKIALKKQDISIPYSTLFKLFKRFEISVFNSLAPSIKEVEIINDNID